MNNIRKSKEELEQIKQRYNTDQLWSWSKFNTYKTSPFEYKLNYIDKIKQDKTDSAFGAYGNAIHSCLENYYSGNIKYEDMINEFEDVLFTLELSNLKFDRTNEDKNKNISQKYIASIKHFLLNHNPITSNVDLERFLLIDIGGNIFQGYADLIRKDAEGNFIIQDWKSSTIYKGEKIDKEKGQLLLYTEALIQLGVPIDKIKACWNFLKYVNVKIEQANGKISERQIERIKIGESLLSNVKMWLKKLGHTENLEHYLETLLVSNDISCLPKEVQAKYSFDDCYVFVPINQEIIDEMKADVIKTIDEIKTKQNEYEITHNNKLFWDNDVESQSFYFANLCGYSAQLHLPYKEYLEKLQMENENRDNMFSGIGSGNNDESKNDELSWLSEI